MELKELKMYGIDETTDKKLLVVDKLRIENYQNPENVKKMIELLSKKYIFYQYNSEKLKANECDYFFWQYVDYNYGENWQTVDISVYDESVNNNIKFNSLLLEIEKHLTEIDVNITLYYNDIRKIIKKIENDINFREEIKWN